MIQPRHKFKYLGSAALIIVGLGFFAARPAWAASALTQDGDKFTVTVPKDLQEQWHGTFRLQQVSQFHYAQDPGVLIAESLGQTSVEDSGYKTYSHNPTAVYEWVNQFSAQIDSPLREGKLTVENNRATDFVPPTPGRDLNLYASTKSILDNLEKGESTAELSVETVEPGPLADTSKLGIKELIGHGVSHFNSSPHNRRVNIAVGVEKMKGVIIPKGGEFSFNKYLGPVEADQGFLPELVIKAEGTIPELGGGLCQVSSTTFRAAMDAGLPITERRNHAYAVSYYAPQGTDATIYPGVVDLKFVNDTPGSILIWPYMPDANTLVFDFYGTKDDRQVSIGTAVQYDKKSDGSMKADWSRTVTKNGKSVTQTFHSVYKSPALYHKTETFPKPASPDDKPPETIPPTTTTTPAPPANTPSNTPTNSNTSVQ
jgi:vancomycin resistance protein YoaR